jgi:3-oxoacyl-[acyl-carrier protein] reductase
VHTLNKASVLVTGAGRGIGKRLAIGFATRGAKVGLLARSKAEIDLCHLEIGHAGGSASKILADVRDYERMTAVMHQMRIDLGGIDVLVCAAAVQGPIGPFVETQPKAWQETIETNLTGVMNCCRAVLPQMIERRGGKIIVLAGGGARQGRPNFSLYAATKTALVRFVESVAEEVSPHNVQINCLSPGGSYTHMTDQILAAGERAGWREIEDAQQVRMTGGVTAERQVELAVFLASEQSNHITGRLLHVEDNWKKLTNSNVNPELYTLRRIQRV